MNKLVTIYYVVIPPNPVVYGFLTFCTVFRIMLYMLGLFVKVHMFHVTGITNESVNDFFIEAYKCTFDLVVPLLFKMKS